MHDEIFSSDNIIVVGFGIDKMLTSGLVIYYF